MHSKARLNARSQPVFFICDALRCALCVHHVPESIGFGDRADSGAICIRLSGRHHRHKRDQGAACGQSEGGVPKAERG